MSLIFLSKILCLVLYLGTCMCFDYKIIYVISTGEFPFHFCFTTMYRLIVFQEKGAFKFDYSLEAKN